MSLIRLGIELYKAKMKWARPTKIRVSTDIKLKPALNIPKLL
jgi:hypothetical protein